MSEAYHIPAMLNETIDGLVTNPDGLYVDLTFGGGGHSKAILNKLSSKGRLISFDQDEDALRNLIEDERFIFVQANFKFMTNFLKYHGCFPVDGVLADLGVSFHQFDDSERGFSIRFDGPLDMRMKQDNDLTAYKVVNEYSDLELTRIFKQYGDLKEAYKIARKIERVRKEKPIQTTQELKDIVEEFVRKGAYSKFYAKVFQAIRIEVNKEMDTLERMLMQLQSVLVEGGRLAIISYHSLEDKMVKNLIKSGNLQGEVEKDFFGNVIRPFEEINRKVIVPSDKEIEMNNRSRSAKLRIAEKIEFVVND